MADDCVIRSGVTREFIVAASATLASARLLGQSLKPSLAVDRHRPRYHLMPPSAWLNDPNGPLYWKGQYHLFYQYAPVISNVGTKYWGHAVSSDLVHWKNLGIALAPTRGGPDKDGRWSGSAVIANGIPTLVYTGATCSSESEFAERAQGLVPERQMVAVAADPNDVNLTKWNKIAGNPVLAAPPAGIRVSGWRDPSLWRERDAWWAWIREKRSAKAQAAAGWVGVMSLPRLLTLRDDGSLGVEPVTELKALRREPKRISQETIEPNGPLLLNQFRSDCAEIEMEIDMGSSHQAGVRVRSTDDGSEQTLIGYDRDSQKLFSDTTSSSKSPETEKSPSFLSGRGIQSGPLRVKKNELLRMRTYIDASVIEVFANGRASLSDRVYPENPASLGIGLFAKGGTARIRSMTVWELAPISNDRLTSGAELFKSLDVGPEK